MAATYPLEIVQAERWAKANKSLKGDKLDEALAKQDWDASIKALVATPTVLAMMNDDLDWTEKLGDAVLAQQADVMDAIQRLRAKAEANGKLKTTKEQKVTVTKEADNSRSSSSSPPRRRPSMCPITSRRWSTAPGIIRPTRLITFRRRQAGWLAAPSRAASPGARASPSATPSGTASIGTHGNINVDIDKNVNINKHVDRNKVKTGNWEHNPQHRKGVNYKDKSGAEQVRQGRGQIGGSQARLSRPERRAGVEAGQQRSRRRQGSRRQGERPRQGSRWRQGT